MCDIEPYHRKNAAEMKGTAIAVEGTGPNSETVLHVGPDSYLKFYLWGFFSKHVNSL